MKQIHIISHTHWDREWYQTFQQFRLRLVHLTDKLLALLEADPSYRYFMLDGQTIVLEDYLEMRPHQLETLQAHIRSGRLLIGPWYILPDEFLVSPEATIRNLLLGKKLCSQFDGRMPIGYIPDPFGHIGQMPQILKGFDIQTACFWRGLSDEPCELWWQAPDGSQVFTLYLRDSYSNGAGLPANDPHQFARELSKLADSLYGNSLLPKDEGRTVIMFGTDHMEPPINTTAALRSATDQLTDSQVLHSTLPQAIAAIQAEITAHGIQIPTVQGELRSSKRMPLLPGVLSTRMWIKQRNHACENLLERWAEPFSTLASYLAVSDPLTSSGLGSTAELLQQAWKLLIQCHPHDSICGCSIDQVHAEMAPRFDQVEQIGEEITRQSSEAIASKINTLPPAGLAPASALVVFNPTQYPQTDTVTATLSLPSSITSIKIQDENGKGLPHQLLGLGNKDLFAMTLDRKGLEESANMIHEGRVAGMAVREINVRCEENIVHLNIILAETGEPDLPAWEKGSLLLRQMLADASIQAFVVRARTVQAVQVTFTAPQVPAMGYRTFWVYPVAEKAPQPAKINPMLRMAMPLAARLSQHPKILGWIGRISAPRAKKPYRITNDLFTVEADPHDGTLTLTDQRTGRVLPGLNQFKDGSDCGDEYNFAPAQQDEVVTARLKRVEIENGPARQTMVLHLEMRTPLELTPDRKARTAQRVILPITCRVVLHHGVPRVDIETEINNTARDHRLRVHFPTPIHTAHADHAGHFEVVRRSVAIPTGGPDWVEDPRPEVPQRAFTTLSDGESSLTLANRGLPEIEAYSDAAGTGLALTLLRCVGWLSRDDFTTRKGHAGPMMATPAAQEPGVHVFHYSVIPHAGSWESAAPAVHGFDTPLRAISLFPQSGPLPPSHNLVDCSGPLQITCLKTTEDGSGVVLRGWGTSSGEVCLQTSLPLHTLHRARLDETPTDLIPPDQPDHWIVPIRQYEILTLILT